MNNILLLGGTGFVGRQICEQLVRAGLRVTVPTRREVNARAVQPLPGVTVLEADVHDEAELARLLPGHDAVVNLVGVLHGNQQRFERAHVELPRKLARAMQAAGIRRLVHVSALGASAWLPRPGMWRPRPGSCTCATSWQPCPRTASASRCRSGRCASSQAGRRIGFCHGPRPTGSVTSIAAPPRARASQ